MSAATVALVQELVDAFARHDAAAVLGRLDPAVDTPAMRAPLGSH